MTKKLFTVTIQAEIVVVADDAVQAGMEAAKVVRDLTFDGTFGYHAEPMRHFPAEFDGNCMPFGEGDPADPDRTIDAWIEKGAAPEYVAMQERFQRRSGGSSSPPGENRKAILPTEPVHRDDDDPCDG